MRLARRLALLSIALCAALAASPSAAGATVTCTTFAGGARPDRPTAAPFGPDTQLDSSCAQAVLNVSPNPAAPGALVTLDGSQSVSDGTTPIDGYQWDFGDGATAQTDAQTTSETHTYARGSYTPRLTILDSSDAPLDTTGVDLIVDDPPVAALSAPSGTLRPGVAYDFDASASSTPDSGIGGSVVRYDWDWGDGTTTLDGGPTPSHAFTVDSTPRVTVTVYDDLGRSASASASVTVFDQLPLVTLIATPSTAQVGQAVRLDASGSSDPDGSIAEYRWDLDGNGSFETSTGMTPTVAVAGGYPNPGPITLSVKVIDDSGGSSVKGVTVRVVAPPGDGGSGGSGSGSGTGSGSGSGATRSGGGGSGGSSGSGPGSSSGGDSGGSAGSGPERFAVSLSGTAIQRLKAALRRGVGLLAMANRAASGKLTMTVTARDAKTLHLRGRHGNRPVAIGTLKLSLRAGRAAKPAIKLTRAAARALAHAKPHMLRVTIRGSLSAAGESAAVVRVVLLKR